LLKFDTNLKIRWILFSLLPIIPRYFMCGFLYKAVFLVQNEIILNETWEIFYQNFYKTHGER